MKIKPSFKIEKMAHGGAGITRLVDGRICFVEGALPGEEVAVEFLKQKKDYALAYVTDIFHANPSRILPKCPYYGKCGGCSMQHLSDEYQNQIAKETVEELFLRFANVSLPLSWNIISGHPWNYRNRARFFRYKKQWGLHARKSERVIVLDKCPILSKGLSRELENNSFQWPFVSELHFFDNGKGETSFYYPQMSKKDFQKNSLNRVSLLGKEISMDASVFFQSNLGLLGELVGAVKNAAGKGKWLIDLFSGVGFFSVFLENQFERITAVEREPACLFHAKKNLSPHCEFISDSAEKWLSENIMNGADTLLVDPPRVGLSASVREILGKSSVNRLLYVSCDPATLARDFGDLKRYGFQIENAQGFAFYPQTPHLEMFLTLVR